MNTSIKEQFRKYLSNCVQTRRQTGKSFIIGRTAVDSYVSFVEADKLFDYAPDEWRDIDSIFDITSSEKILQIIEKLFSDERFKAKDSGESSQYYRSNAIKQYYCFMKARELFINTDNYSISKEFEYERIPLQQIFYGAPGTGKSHTINEITEKQSKENVFRTTFHPDSDYATFVGCYKPTKEATSILSLHKLHELYPEFKTKVGNRPLHRFITKYSNSFRLLTEKEAESVFDKIETSSTVTAEVPKIMAAIEEIPTISSISYSFVPQTFTKAYLRAWQTEEPVYLVIEEINRGNCAQIFGDLFQLLDRKNGFSEYPIKPDNDLATYIGEQLSKESREGILETVKSGEELILPPNLYIWATMNTSDQSLFPIDSAFKRRWEWKYLPIENADKGWKIQVNGSVYDWYQFLEVVNREVFDLTHSEDKQLGYFFVKAKNNVVDAETLVNKVYFYLWTDVFKVYGIPSVIGSGREWSFAKFYNPDGSVNEAKVKELMAKLNIEAIPFASNEDGTIDVEVMEASIDANNNKNHLKEVRFPDGVTYDTSVNAFDAYIKTIEKIGVEKVASVADQLKYRRLGKPLISTEKYSELDNNGGYSYHQIGNYYFVRGAKTYTYVRILEDLNDMLGVGMTIVCE